MLGGRGQRMFIFMTEASEHARDVFMGKSVTHAA